ncbi:amino acid adenylation domain-containing protein [Streptomyces sp. S.PNR 29]|uniref:amino acid adenylation domain-containing protein n=1 Tax=Streptomyces sp. S.PNR 29 TaxID=2973805 RepID=UPI0025AEDDE8|nr:amino acid adenylation domain-containing protein [Streptomyces sp. S.PNR 29]MDN0197622.1 amino acid adenylation domain-containing protein [Streptomyces sp. S.PNR 29]
MPPATSPVSHHSGLLHKVFQDVARRAPHRVAVTEPGGPSLTYGDLDSRAESLASRLRAHGIGKGEFVGLCLERGADLIVGLLGILKAGGAYVPLDPDHPAARLDLLLEDTGLRTVVAGSRTVPLFAGRDVRLVLADEGGAEAAAAEAIGETADGGPENGPAYVIHTSGSTGVPKGVVVEHGNVVRLFTTTADRFGFGPDDVWTLFHSVGFDFSVWEIWGALLHGGRLVIVPKEAVRMPERLLALLEDEGVTVLSQTPSAFRGLIAAEGERPDKAGLALRLVVFGGERLDVALLRPWIERHGDTTPELVNMYGITETTVHVTVRRIHAADLRQPEVSPIGVPLPDLRVRLVDEEGRVVQVGTPGEIQVGGPGVTRGYLNRPELTAARFVEEEGCRWYRSGDRAVQSADGELLYLGRTDDQIKVRGYRIEPGEVEHCLVRHEGVSAAVVVARDYDGDVRLVAYVLPSPAADTAQLAGHLAEHARTSLPAYLRPAVYRLLAEVPLTPQGKTDRAALDAHLLDEPTTEAPGAGGAGRPPAGGVSETEAVVARIVEKVLERSDIGPDQDVFEAGATSLAFARILAEIQREFGVGVDLAALEDTASIRRLAAVVTPLAVTTHAQQTEGASA